MKAILDFFAYWVAAVAYTFRNFKEQLCRGYGKVIKLIKRKECVHDWVPTRSIDRKYDRVYARCSRCPAVR